jgi:hypothetical protein
LTLGQDNRRDGAIEQAFGRQGKGAMTVFVDNRGITPAAQATDSPFRSVPVMVALAFVIVLAIGWPTAVLIWREGPFLDADDAMRLVEVRDFLAGQGWFDLVAHRLDPPQGVLMHWSRLVDLPLALCIRLLASAAGEGRAETIVRIAWPLSLHLALLATIVSLARRLGGTATVAPAACAAAFAVATSSQFIPGRIDHHNVQILLMALMLRAATEALDPATRSRPAALAAAAMAALSLAITIENLPFIAALCGSFGLAWIVSGRDAQAQLAIFGLALALSALAAFAATVPPARYGLVVCDNYAVPYAIAATMGGAGLGLLAALSPRLVSPSRRALAAAIAAAAIAGAVSWLYPACLHDPLAGVDPLLRQYWLDNVLEARPFAVAWRDDPATFGAIALPIAIGLGWAFAALRKGDGLHSPWMPLLLFALAGCVGAAWQVRVLPPLAIVAVPGLAFGVVSVYRRLRAWSPPWRYAMASLVMAAGLTPAWSLALAALPVGKGPKTTIAGTRACLARANIERLAALPTGLVLAPIDLGAHLLVYTPHRVLAAPYHRNNDGNRAALDALIGAPDAGEAIARRYGITYVMTCDRLTEAMLYASKAPAGLSAALARGEVPAWLQPVPIEGSTIKVFRVRT